MKLKKMIFAILTFVIILICLRAEAIQLSAMSQEAIMANNKWRNGIKRYSIEIMPPKLKKYKDRSCLEVNGKSNFPDDTRIYVFLKKGNHSLDCKVVRLTNGLFTTSFGPLDLKKFEGEYEIEASLMRIEQNTAKVKKIIGEKGQNITDVADGTIISLKGDDIEKVSTFYSYMLGSKENINKKKELASKDLKDILVNLEVICNKIYTSYNDYQEGKDVTLEAWLQEQSEWLQELDQNEKEINNNYNLSVLDSYPNTVKYLELTIANLRQLDAVCSQNIGIKDKPINNYKSNSPEVLARTIKTDINRIGRSLVIVVSNDEVIIP
jgi:hypothetical protein